ncbi:tripartite tricarboxylate transporter receptor family protein [Paraburkholderia xenovorans LB400]|uniref:Tripartite tricarboxylate transporter(TTT) family, periplasmic ligand binding protein TctC n=1 Tax=Paraburkholderia xenovorans (strain LB400) TaxID=266265 RepID=Q13PZ7_PARXL|nr:tripartite tricarboxylate transporter substrate binding protein [Paraburkholderia xenovorans]ABE33842.1 putative tripartite tricarboxylate transporter(TTT) family, periplasmic ligand binding protein TctC [Paraburkholderia xenovorans LB400]AIP36526.1 tripartite tricarboxylate transporter receptor family protein [Paraburkholderia xenovorans LB400]
MDEPTRRNVVTRRTCLASLAALAASAWIPAARADYPDSPIRIIIAFPAGAGEAEARIVAKTLGAKLGQPVIVEAHPGAGGNIAAAYVAKSRGDGYTLLLGVSTFFETNPMIYRDIGYQPADLQPVSIISEQPFLLIVNASLPVHSLQELIAYARARPGKVTNATAGPGSPLDLIGKEFMVRAGVQIINVPYKGGGEDAMAVLGGFCDMLFGGVADVTAGIQSGKMRPICVTGSRRLPHFPDLPTIAEAGLQGYDFSVWNCLSAPASTPAPVVEKLHAAIVQTMASPEVQAGFDRIGFFPVSGTGAELSRRIATETEVWRGVLKKAGVAPQ